MFVANFYRGADWLRRFGNGNPVDGFDFKGSGSKGVVVADEDAIGFRFDGEDVERLAGGEAEALALADSEIVNAIVAAEDFAGFGDDIAVACAERNFIFRSVGVDELDVAAVGDKAQLHAVRLFGDGESGAASDFADFVFREFAKREFTARELFLRKAPEKIGLIFCGIERAKKLETAGGFVAADAGVVAGSEAIGADLAGHAKKRFELHVGIAIGAGDGSTAAEIVFDEGADDAVLELRFEIDDVVRKIQVLRDPLGVVNIVERTAAVLSGSVALEFRQAALVPELHGEADNGAALLLKHGGHGGRVDATRHGHGDQARRRLCANGQRRFKLGTI